MWAILLTAIVGVIPVQKWDDIYIGTTYKMSVTNLVYFLSRDTILLMWAHIACKLTKTIIAGALLRLAIGKIVDEFVHPFGYWYGELLWDIGVVVWAVYRWVQVNRKWD